MTMESICWDGGWAMAVVTGLQQGWWWRWDGVTPCCNHGVVGSGDSNLWRAGTSKLTASTGHGAVEERMSRGRGGGRQARMRRSATG